MHSRENLGSQKLHETMSSICYFIRSYTLYTGMLNSFFEERQNLAFVQIRYYVQIPRKSHWKVKRGQTTVSPLLSVDYFHFVCSVHYREINHNITVSYQLHTHSSYIQQYTGFECIVNVHLVGKTQ
jgi:hypothetical protein